MEKVLETLLKDTGGSQKLEQVHKSARCFFIVEISSPWLCNEESGGNDDYSRLGLDFLESYSRAPATDYRKQVTPCHVKEGCEKIRNKKQQQKLPKEKKTHMQQEMQQIQQKHPWSGRQRTPQQIQLLRTSFLLHSG